MPTLVPPGFRTKQLDTAFLYFTDLVTQGYVRRKQAESTKAKQFFCVLVKSVLNESLRVRAFYNIYAPQSRAPSIGYAYILKMQVFTSRCFLYSIFKVRLMLRELSLVYTTGPRTISTNPAQESRPQLSGESRDSGTVAMKQLQHDDSVKAWSPFSRYKLRLADYSDCLFEGVYWRNSRPFSSRTLNAELLALCRLIGLSPGI